MRIAKPLLAVTTPVGMAIGLYEAWQFGRHLAVLMGLMMAVVAGLILFTVRRIRAERRMQDRPGD
jgi:zinc transporter ZupT